MRQLLLGGVASLVLATPLLAQATATWTAPIVPAAPAASTAALLDRLNALEARVQQLEARNRALEAQASASPAASVAAAPSAAASPADARFAAAPATGAPAAVLAAAPGKGETAKGAVPAILPTFDFDPNFTFKPRGMLQLDYAHYRTRAGGYVFADGTDIRRGRFGFDGTAFRIFRYRLDAEFVNNVINLLDAYLQYQPSADLLITVGQQKSPYGLEANSPDAFNEFMERGMANAAFGTVGAERRIGLNFTYQRPMLIAQLGLFGPGEAVARNPVTPNEAVGVNGRLVLEPVNRPGAVLHVGASGYRVGRIAGNAIANLGDRPGTRVDGGLIEAVTIAPVVTGPAALQTRGASVATLLAGEAAAVYGRFSLQGEYQHLRIDRYDAVPALQFDGFYAFASLFLTGESRAFRGGLVDRLRPRNNFDPAAGHWGAFELAARYDRLDLTDHALSPLAHVATTWTGALNWYLNPNMKLLFNYVHFKGLNSPLVAPPVALNGTTAAGDTFATRLHLDF